MQGGAGQNFPQTSRVTKDAYSSVYSLVLLQLTKAPAAATCSNR